MSDLNMRKGDESIGAPTVVSPSPMDLLQNGDHGIVTLIDKIMSSPVKVADQLKGYNIHGSNGRVLNLEALQNRENIAHIVLASNFQGNSPILLNSDDLSRFTKDTRAMFREEFLTPFYRACEKINFVAGRGKFSVPPGLADAVEFYEIIPEELLLGYLSDKSILTHKIDPDNSDIITKVSFIDGGKKLMRYLRQIDLDESNRITDLVLDIKKLDFNKNNLPGEEIEVETTDYDDEINSPVNATAKLDESIHSLVSMTNQKFKLAFLRDSLASSNGLLQIKNDSVAPDSKNNNGNVQNPYNI